jgi:GNAT superfamily N-acetyltransferase
MEITITYVEMTGPDELVPGRPVDGLTLDRVERTSPLIPSIQARVGAPYGWGSANRTPEEWAVLLARPGHDYWIIRYDGEDAGIVVIVRQLGGDIEIETFGLLPEFVGKGLGGHALTLAVRQAWATPDAEGGPARRVWLHTADNDNPAALPNYRKRGFRPYKTVIDHR